MNLPVQVWFTKGPNRTTANARAWLNTNNFTEPTLKRDRPGARWLKFSIEGRSQADFPANRLGGENRFDINGNIRIIWAFARLTPRKRIRGTGTNNQSEARAEKIYNLALDHIESVVGNKALFDDTLKTLGRDLLGKKFAGVYPVDLIKFPPGKKYMIFNTDISTMSGEHWMALVKEKNMYYVYDSFGRSTQEIAPILFKQAMKRIVDADQDAEQGIEEENCGQRSLSFLFVWDQFGKKLAMKI